MGSNKACSSCDENITPEPSVLDVHIRAEFLPRLDAKTSNLLNILSDSRISPNRNGFLHSCGSSHVFKESERLKSIILISILRMVESLKKLRLIGFLLSNYGNRNLL
jgi:hypothetical protein